MSLLRQRRDRIRSNKIECRPQRRSWWKPAGNCKPSSIIPRRWQFPISESPPCLHKQTDSAAVVSLGDDGAWSTFHINVGNPPTQLSVLASTEIPETWVVGPEGCVTTDPSNCTQARGGTYNGDNSTTWKTINNYSLGAESNLGLTQNSDNGQYGFDTLAVAVPGGGNVSLDHQLIARLATKDFYLGNLGLANRQLLLGGDRESGFLSHINASNLIPSLSYGYTAGASYRKRRE